MLRHGKADQMAESPCHGVTVSLDETVPTVRSPYDSGDFTRYRGLLCDDYLHDIFGYFQWLFFRRSYSRFFRRAVSLRA